MSNLTTFDHRLKLVPRIEVRETLVRCVALMNLVSNCPPDFLYASGRPNRYNPAGVDCVYFADQETAARLEYAAIWGRGAAGAKQPFATYFAKVRLTNVLDLTDPEVLLLLRLKFKDLYADWRGASSPTKTQLLGLAVSAPHSNIAAIRYPSRAAQSTRTAATNLVIFPNQISAPDYVRILGPQKRPLQAWP